MWGRHKVKYGKSKSGDRIIYYVVLGLPYEYSHYVPCPALQISLLFSFFPCRLYGPCRMQVRIFPSFFTSDTPKSITYLKEGGFFHYYYYLQGFAV